MRGNRYFWLGIIVIIFCVCVGIFISTQKKSGVFSWSDERKKWQVELARSDARDAYTVFKNSFEDVNSPQVRHAGAHLFGELLYDRLQIDAISVCDSSFESGCYHGVLTKTLSNFGEDGIGLFFKACKTLPAPRSGCVHSIGHGLVQLHGRQSLASSLAICESLEWDGTPFGCVGGVFMEYMFPNIFSDVGEVTQGDNVLPHDLGALCGQLPDEYQDACYFQTVQAWRDILANDVKEIEKRCDNIRDLKLQKTCYFSIGATHVAVERQSAQSTHEYCMGLSESSHTLLCHAGSAFGYKLAGDTKQANSICVLSGQAQSCDAHASRYDMTDISPL